MQQTSFVQRVGVFVALFTAACASEQTGREGNFNRGGQGGVGGTTAAGAGGFGTAQQPPLAGTISLPAGAGGTGGDDGLCGGTTLDAMRAVIQTTVEVPVEVTETEPVALYIVLDRSASMNNYEWSGTPGPGGGGGSLWDLAVTSLTGLVNDPASANVDIALEYFPPDNFGDEECDGVEASMPTVAIGRLPGHATNIVGSLNSTMPNGSGTPIEAALRGGAQFCASFKASTPGEDCAVLLVTDGEPSGCSEDYATLAAIAGDAFQASAIQTFAIGIGEASFELLDQIATAGGTDCDPASPRTACDATTGELQAALTTIRETITTTTTRTEIREEIVETPLDCEWNVPAADPGSVFDADLVNVRFTSAPSAPPSDFGRVDSADACGAQSIAWHYDNPAAPARILACPETCAAIKAASQGRIEVLLGCPVYQLQ